MSRRSEYSELYEKFISSWLDPAVTEIEAHTSGSTGKPKNIILPKSVMQESARRTISYFKIDSEWLLGSCISAEFIGGKMMAARALEAGCGFFCEEPSNRPEIIPAREKSVTNALISVVPSQMWNILNLNLDTSEKQRIKFLIGGSALPADLRKEIVRNNIQAWESYGMTETSSHIALRRVSNEDIPFTPLPGIKLSKSSSGTLIINFCEGLNTIQTNDMVDFDSAGNFKILGRADNVIVTGGLKVFPEQLEEKLRKIISQSDLSKFISDLMVTSRPDAKWGEAIVLKLEVSSINSNVDSALKLESGFMVKEIDRIIRADGSIAKSILLRHEYPKEILCVQELPRTPNGKLRR